MLRREWLLLVLVACGTKKAELATLSDPNDPEAWEHLGNVYRTHLRKSMASDAYRMALSLDPSRTYLARRTQSHGLSKEAKALREQAMADPQNDELWGDLGDLLVAQGNPLEARGAYLRAYRLDPADSEWQRALINLGETQMILDQLTANLVDTDDEQHGDLGDLLMAAGRRDEACEHYRRAAELDPADEEWINHATECGYPIPEGWGQPTDTGAGLIGGLVGVDGGYDGGWSLAGPEDLESLTQQLGQDGDLLVRLGQAHLRAGNREEATKNLWDALLVDPTSEEALQSWMAAAQKTRREGLEKLRDLFPENDEVVGLLADHYLDLGLRDRARDLYDLAHRLDEEDPEWEAKRILLGSQP